MIIFCGPNVIESEEHTLKMAQELKAIFQFYDVNFYFKVSFDKANRSSLSSYRGPGLEKGLKILKRVKDQVGVNIITDIHEPWQAEKVAKVVNIIQIPAFLCRQTDLLEAAAKTGLPVHVKKGQCFSADVMHKCKEKLLEFGAKSVMLCERGSMYGYQDLIVDPRNLIWLKSDTNDVSMDITHCLQQPAKKMADGTVKAGGIRDMIPYMGKMAIALGVDAIFIEVHDEPDKALCDAPTQWPLDKLQWLLNFLKIKKKYKQSNKKKLEVVIPCRLNSSRLSSKMLIQIDNEFVINRTINQIKKSIYDDAINVVTDSNKIANILDKNINKIVKQKDYNNGIERISNNIDLINCSHILVIHGDQPFIDPKNINIMINYFYNNEIDSNEILMGYSEICEEEAENKSVAKVVTDTDNYLLYISRSKIPFNKSNCNVLYKKGSSIIIIPKNKLLEYKNIKMSNLQKAEDNEWIKFIDKLDCKIKCIKINFVERDLNDKNDYIYLMNKYDVKKN